MQKAIFYSALIAVYFVVSFFSQQVHALKLIEVKLPLVKAKSKSSNSLDQQKKAELDRRWVDCVNLGSSNLQKFPQLKAWIALSMSECAQRIKPAKANYLNTAYEALNSLKNLKGPWQKELPAETQKLLWLTAGAQAKLTPAKVSEPILTELFAREGQLETRQRLQIYAWAAQKAQNQGQLQAALQFIEQSLSLGDSPESRGLEKSIRLALNLPPKLPPPPEAAVPPWNEQEAQFEQRLEESQRSEDAMRLLEDSLAYLKKFPLGRKAEWADSKVTEIYNQFFDLAQKPEAKEKMTSVLSRAQGLIKKADHGRLFIWARATHRRGDFRGSLEFADAALRARGGTADAATLNFIIGRSAQFLGNYNIAKTAFQNYLSEYSGGEDIIEVLFRLGLVYVRQGEPASAIAVFEKLLTQKNIDRYELSARYWLVRCLQATGNSRVDSEIEYILEKNMFSYYGLRLLSERQNGRLAWPTTLKQTSALKGKLWLTEEQKKSLDRALVLVKAEWYGEAQREIAEMPLPDGADIRALWAGELAEAQAFPKIIKIIGDLGDGNADFKSLDLIGLGFPQAHQVLIEENAKRQRLESVLVKSLIRQESAFNVLARSKSNALGLMQLIPPTATEVAGELGMKDVNVPDDLFSPRVNLQMGTYYIRKMLNEFDGNVPMALAAYNAGPTRMGYFVEAREELAVLRGSHSSEPKNEIWFDELPWFETSFYVKAILRNTLIYKMIDRAKPDSKPETRQFELAPVLWSDLVLTP
jgi:soluble lytic murein transglycosylase